MRMSLSRGTEGQQASFPVSPYRMFEDFLNDWALRSAGRRESWTPPVDILEKDGDLILRVEVPGVNEKEIELKLDGRVLTIRGERKPEFQENGHNYHQIESFYGTFSRSFTLPDTVDSKHIKAGYKNGVLTITIPQKPEVKARSIAVSGG